jgi:hypothetical protein
MVIIDPYFEAISNLTHIVPVGINYKGQTKDKKCIKRRKRNKNPKTHRT